MPSLNKRLRIHIMKTTLMKVMSMKIPCSLAYMEIAKKSPSICPTNCPCLIYLSLLGKQIFLNNKAKVPVLEVKNLQCPPSRVLEKRKMNTKNGLVLEGGNKDKGKIKMSLINL